jgi:hypothetical protein
VGVGSPPPRPVAGGGGGSGRQSMVEEGPAAGRAVTPAPPSRATLGHFPAQPGHHCDSILFFKL